MKPDARLYEVVERLSGCRGAELLYIDDLPRNIEAGRARGWQVILQEQPETTLAGSFDSRRQVIERHRVKVGLDPGRDFCSPTLG